MAIRVLVDSKDESYVLNDEDNSRFHQVVSAVLDAEEIKEDVEVSISLVSPEDIQRLNLKYRGKDSDTDVLSFPLDEVDPQGVRYLGDVVINLEKVRKQGEEYGHGFQREMVYLTVHSLLHLLGYDHMEDGEKREMRLREEEIMKRLGLPQS